MWRYVGDGAFVPGIPARDLSDEEAQGLGRRTIRACGLYKFEAGDVEETPAEEEVTDGQ
jgi:hypothetical protein